jgi:hypothetical protein
MTATTATSSAGTPLVAIPAETGLELTDALRLITDWLASDRIPLAESLLHYIGSDVYDLHDLRADLTRLADTLDGGLDGGLDGDLDGDLDNDSLF